MEPIERNGWKIYFHPDFALQYADFLDRLEKLADKLSAKEYTSHYPRKEGDKRDCYAIFSQRVKRGTYPESFDDLINQVE